MQLRYAFRLYPDAAQRAALARAFGCARVVFNDAVRAREDARKAGRPFPTAGQLSTRLITDLPDLLHLRRRGRTQTPRRPGMDLYRLRRGPRPGPQCRDQRQTGRRTGGTGLRSAGKTRRDPGTARRNRKPWIPDRTPCRVAAQRPVREGQNPRPSGRGACQGEPYARHRTVPPPVIVGDEPGSFAHGVLAERHPAIIRQVRDAFPYDPAVRGALDATLESCLKGVIEPLPADAHEGRVWGNRGISRAALRVRFTRWCDHVPPYGCLPGPRVGPRS